MWCVNVVLLHLVEQAWARPPKQSNAQLCQHNNLQHQFYQQHSSHLLPMTSLQFYKYTAPADGVVIPWACSDGFNATLSVDDGTGDQNCIGPFNGCDDPQISNPDSQTT